MNWLAHLLLSEPTPGFMVGSILPDLVITSRLAGLDPEVMLGIKRHLDTDTFTDAHPVFKRSVRRFEKPLRSYGGIITDVLYDHFLTKNWDLYSPVKFPRFTATVYDAFGKRFDGLPAEAYTMLEKISKTDLLGSYSEVSGVEKALRGIRLRLSRPFDADLAIEEIQSKYDLFSTDFNDFFPELYKRYKS